MKKYKIISKKAKDSKKYENSKIIVDCVKIGYERQWSRKSKLDSKLNVTITIAGLYVSVFSYLYNVKDIFLKNNYSNADLFIRYTYITSIIASLVLFIIGAIKILLLLKANRYKVPDTKEMIKRSRLENKPFELNYILASEIAESVDYNNKLLNKEFKSYNTSLMLIVISVMLSVFALCFRINFLGGL